MRNLTLRFIETYTVHNIKQSLTINLDDYPETSDMSELEAKEWIQNNVWDMPAYEGSTYTNLGEELNDKDVTQDKEYDYEYEVDFLDATEDEEFFFGDEE